MTVIPIQLLLLLLALGILLLVWIGTNPNNESLIRKVFFTRSRILMPLRIIETILFIEVVFPNYFYTILLDSTFMKYTGISFVYAGLAFSIWAKLTMKKSWGVPAQHNKTKQNSLITSGAFQYSRNPIYVGLIAIALGFQLALSSWFIVFIPFVFLYFDVLIEKEEKLLYQYFGKKYSAYTQRVRRFL
jgi:protein-S-isoprenylcysteine O-methyltransferase Ste14